jgi:hypothetical protein
VVDSDFILNAFDGVYYCIETGLARKGNTRSGQNGGVRKKIRVTPEVSFRTRNEAGEGGREYHAFLYGRLIHFA